MRIPYLRSHNSLEFWEVKRSMSQKIHPTFKIGSDIRWANELLIEIFPQRRRIKLMVLSSLRDSTDNSNTMKKMKKQKRSSTIPFNPPLTLWLMGHIAATFPWYIIIRIRPPHGVHWTWPTMMVPSNFQSWIWKFKKHNIIQVHNDVMWDWPYSTELSPHLVWIWGIFCGIVLAHITLSGIWIMLWIIYSDQVRLKKEALTFTNECAGPTNMATSS